MLAQAAAPPVIGYLISPHPALLHRLRPHSGAERSRLPLVRFAVRLNPLSYGVDGLRGVLDGGSRSARPTA